MKYKDTIKRYKQTRDVGWLKTPEDTIWRTYGYRNYIQPEDEDLWETPFGVNLDLLDETPEENLFELITEINENRTTEKIISKIS